VILKPATGILDLTSKTSEGLRNTAIYYDDKANEERVRYPRVFYDK
jgi:vacuolar protein sorting-associated protein 13A/C